MTVPVTRIRPAGRLAEQPTSEIEKALREIAIVTDQAAELVVIKADEFAALSAAARAAEGAAEDAADRAAFERTKDQERVPAELVDRLLAGENPVRVWRQHRGLTLEALAGAAGIGKAYLSQIETGGRTGPIATMRRLATALQVDLDDLT